MKANDRPAKAAAASAAGHVTTFVEPPTTVGDSLLLAEINLLRAARRIEWAAVELPQLERTARLAYHAAHRLHGDRLEVAA